VTGKNDLGEVGHEYLDNGLLDVSPQSWTRFSAELGYFCELIKSVGPLLFHSTERTEKIFLILSKATSAEKEYEVRIQ
jgi:hypothetical protein